jgi:CheY-like chemotaxis protein
MNGATPWNETAQADVTSARPLHLADDPQVSEPQAPLLRMVGDDEPVAQLPTVLVVDDDVFVCQAVACILREARGARVETARDGDEALRLARAILPDLIVLDIRMPGTPVAEVCRQLRAMSDLSGTRLYVLTGILADGHILEELQPLIDGMMTKPPDPRRLVALVDEGSA